ncbi:hypothetical protein CAPTEDRAFT_203639 [Capitella teleta]|uniref:Ig-like domain-containing protein n=1 Tax=Capitella teleta TaxID=283909 RepID=R7V6U8_CAPTE|nr:hypothetical protein CAPTEDRAFT_203639 [Capitella teleta]|eukprot:ELU14284.1 hypothetical protein CAPTEDRAFT_203639 [Capitella teleta]
MEYSIQHQHADNEIQVTVSESHPSMKCSVQRFNFFLDSLISADHEMLSNFPWMIDRSIIYDVAYQISFFNCLRGLTWAGDMTIVLDVSETMVHPGTDVNFVCRVTNMDPSYMIWWFKAVVESDGPAPFGLAAEDPEWETNELVEQIAINDLMTDYYDELPRYSVAMSSVEGARIFTLNIADVTDGENGYFGCLVGQEKSVIATRMLEVIKPPSDLTFENVTSNITLTEGETLSMACHVRKAVPSPTVTMSVGHATSHFRSIDSQFQRDTQVNFNCQEGVGTSKTCPLNVDYSVSLSGSYNPIYTDNKKFLKCEASYPDYMNLPAVSEQIEIFYECE